MANRPTLKQYLLKLAPDFSTLDLVEQFASNNNISGQFKDIFFYKETKDNIIDVSTNFYRGIFKIVSTDTEITFTPNMFTKEDYIVIKKSHDNEYTYYIIIASSDLIEINFKLSKKDELNESHILISGVAF